MHERLSLSRRNAAMLIAGTFGAGAVPAGAAEFIDGNVTYEAPPDLSRRRMTVLLADVRRANDARLRTRAFERCKAVLRMREYAQAQCATPTDTALYRQADPAAALTRVIVREIDALPASDPQWLRRFDDLERVVQAQT